MASFPPAPPRIHEEQIVLTRHDAHNNYHCLDKSCVCWADEHEPFAHEPDEEEYALDWDALQDVPSYVEQQAAAFAQEV